MGFSSTTNYQAATSTIPVATQTSTVESQNTGHQTQSRKKGLLSTILSSQRRKKQSATSSEMANSTLG